MSLLSSGLRIWPLGQDQGGWGNLSPGGDCGVVSCSWWAGWPRPGGVSQLRSSVTQQSTPPCWPEAVNRPHLWPLRTVQGTRLCFSHPFRELFTCLRQTLSVPSTEGHKNLAPLIHRTDQFNVPAYGSWPASCFTYLVSLCRAGRNHDTILPSSAPELLGGALP